MSEKAKHTPGPWYYEENKHADNIGIYKDVTKQNDSWPSAQCIAFLDTIEGHTRQPIPEAKANARLISSAPEMLEMLYTLLPCAEESDEFHKPSAKLGPLVRALIAKAEGR